MRIRILPEAERDLDIGCDFYDPNPLGQRDFSSAACSTTSTGF